MILDVDMNTLKMSKPPEKRFFYRENEKVIEVFTNMGNYFLRAVYQKKGDENDTLWRDNNLKNAMRVYNISSINEDEWKQWALNMMEIVEELRANMRFITEKLEDDTTGKVQPERV